MSTVTNPSDTVAPAATAVTEVEKTPIILRTPITSPLPTSVPAPRPSLTPDQQAKYDQLLGRARSWTTVAALDTQANIDMSGPLADVERFWLTRECLLRYLRATDWDLAHAEKRLLETLAWRRTFGLVEYGEGDAKREVKITADRVSKEGETGKEIILGYDLQARPCFHMNVGRQNTKVAEFQIEFVVFMLERAIDMMPPGQETVALLIDFKKNGKYSSGPPALMTSLHVLRILQGHYPERLGRAYLRNLHAIVQMLLKGVRPFIDVRTRDKVNIEKDVSPYVSPENLTVEWGGKINFEYDHGIYWPAFNALCRERHDQRFKRWVEGGKIIGESEDYLAGGVEKSVNKGPEKGEDDRKKDTVSENNAQKGAEKDVEENVEKEGENDGEKSADKDVEKEVATDNGNSSDTTAATAATADVADAADAADAADVANEPNKKTT